MQPSVHAILLSALVFPGAGQWFLKRHARAWLFILPALLGACYFFGQVFERAAPLFEQALNGTLPFDPLLIAARLEQQGDAASPLTSISAALMIGAWAASIIDAWLIGRAAPAPTPPKGNP